jgi:hypothetical protein
MVNLELSFSSPLGIAGTRLDILEVMCDSFNPVAVKASQKFLTDNYCR